MISRVKNWFFVKVLVLCRFSNLFINSGACINVGVFIAPALILEHALVLQYS